MSALAHLAALLVQAGATPDPARSGPAAALGQLDEVIERLQRRARAGSTCREPIDRQRAAVQRFRETRRLETLRETRWVAFGLGLELVPGEGCLLGDSTRLASVLEAADGWVAQPRRYRRIYQGLLWSYFNAAPADRAGPGANRGRLAAYLLRRLPAIRDGHQDPDWVRTLATHPSLFGDSPCEDFVAPLLHGDRSGLDALCAATDIGAASWFLRELVQAQVRRVAALYHEGFLAALPAMLALLQADAWRDDGLALLLERHARLPQPVLHVELRDALTHAWGHAARPRHRLRWDGVAEATRKRVLDWQNARVIEQFFGAAEDRRAAFWLRYVASIRALDLALPDPLPEPPPPVAQGAGRDLLRSLHEAGGGAPSESALVLTIGCARFVVFAGPAEPLWAYDLRGVAPFDLDAPLRAAPDAPNSLRRSGRAVCLAHQDGVDGWRQWEQRFEATLKDKFGIRVGAATAHDPARFIDLSDHDAGADAAAAPDDIVSSAAWHVPSHREDVHWQTAEALSVPYSRPDLEVLARVHGLTLLPPVPGRARARVAARRVDARIAGVLSRWGFERDEAGDWGRRG